MIEHITSSAINQHRPSFKRAETQIENQVSKPARDTTLTSEATQRIVNDKLIEKLDKILQKNGVESVRNLDAADYTPEAVSSRILNFVQEAINRAGTRGVDPQTLLNQAQAGIDQGFEESKNILTSLNALSGAIADNVQKTYDLIQNGMSEVVKKIQGFNSAQAQRVESANYGSATQSISQSLDLEITTQEGDTLRLSLTRDENTGQYAAHISNPDGEASYTEQTYELNNDFSLSVQGNLSDSEISAISDLLGGVKGVADEFFNGNGEAALEAGMNLGYDAGQIASFSLSLNENQSSAVTKAYQEVSYLGSGSDNSSRDALMNLLKPVQGFMNSLHNLFGQTNNSQIFADPKSRVIDMLDYFAKSNDKFKPQLDSLEAKANAPFNSVVSDMVSQLTA